MIRSTQTTKGTLTDPTSFVLAHQDVAAEVFVETAYAIRPQALRALGTMPGWVKHPIQWTSEKQRRAFFATDGFGKGIPYTRRSSPKNLAGAWKFEADTKGDDFKLVIKNDDKAAKYVYGSLANSNPGRFQQRFHVNTGWLNGYREVSFWQSAFNVLYQKNLRKKFQEMTNDFKTKRRAYTAPRRR